MTDDLSLLLIVVRFLAFFTWTALGVVILKQLFQSEYAGLKISGLYLINSVTFILTYGMILKLVFIDWFPQADTKEKVIEILRNRTDNYFTDFIIFSFTATLVLTVVNILYLKFVVKTKILKYTLILFIANLTVLLTASYVSTEYYYSESVKEVNNNF